MLLLLPHWHSPGITLTRVCKAARTWARKQNDSSGVTQPVDVAEQAALKTEAWRTFNPSLFVFSKRILKLSLNLGWAAGSAALCSLGPGSWYIETSVANVAPPPTPPPPEVRGHLCCTAMASSGTRSLHSCPHGQGTPGQAELCCVTGPYWQVLGETVPRMPNPCTIFRPAHLSALQPSTDRQGWSYVSGEAADILCTHAASNLRPSWQPESFIIGLQCPQEWPSGWHFNVEFLAFIKGQKQPEEIRY